MTLVIFQKTGNHIFANADMKMDWNDNRKQPPNISNWRPKAIIIRNDLIICWAGELAFAQNALIEIWNQRLKIDYTDLLHITYNHHKESNKETDFIISDCHGNSHKISNLNYNELKGDCYDYIGDDSLYLEAIKKLIA